MAEKECPRCGLIYPSTVDECSCGHQFIRKRKTEVPLSKQERDRIYQEEMQRIKRQKIQEEQDHQKSLERIIREGKLKRQHRQGKIVMLVCFLFFFVVMVYGLTSKKTTNYQTPAKTGPQENKISRPHPTLPVYTILDEDVSETSGKAQVILRVLVTENITKISLTELLNVLYNAAEKKRGFKWHSTPTVIAIYVFTSEEKAKETNSLQWIAMLSKGPNRGPDIRLHDGEIKSIGTAPEAKHGMTEDARKKIYGMLTQAEDKALKDAGNNTANAEEILQKYYEEIGRKNNLTLKQVTDISIEGFSKNWTYVHWTK